MKRLQTTILLTTAMICLVIMVNITTAQTPQHHQAYTQQARVHNPYVSRTFPSQNVRSGFPVYYPRGVYRPVYPIYRSYPVYVVPVNPWVRGGFGYYVW